MLNYHENTRRTVFVLTSTFFRQVQQMRTPVSTSAKSWTHNKTKSLRKLKSDIRESLYFFSLWRKSLQKIGGFTPDLKKDFKMNVAHVAFLTHLSFVFPVLQGTLGVVSSPTSCSSDSWLFLILFPSC